MRVLVFLLMPSLACAAELFNPMGVLSHAQMEFRVAQSWYQQEREYEAGPTILDERDYRSWLTRLEFGVGLWNGFSLRTNLVAAFDGEFKKSFDPSLSLRNQSTSYGGLQSVGAHLQYYSTTKQLAFEIYGEHGLFDARERNASIGGANAGMAFKYLHLIGHSSIYGRLFLDIAGKKRVWRLDSEREIVDPYAKFGNEINLRRDFGRFWVMLGGHFLLATDFVTRSPSYTRNSDKGFGLGGILEVGANFKNWSVRTWHTRSSEVFNVIPEEPSLQAEFEIEEQNSGLEVAWSW